jgi:electron transfer flavoprotein beta subunit
MKARKKEIRTVPSSEIQDDLTPSLRLLRVQEPAGRAAGVVLNSVDDLLNKLAVEAKVL